MAFVPVTLLTTSVVALVGLGALMLHVARRERAWSPLRWSGAAVLCLGAGFALLLAAPADIDAPVRVLGTATLILSHGLLWGAARRSDRRSATFEAVSAGALVWLLAVALFDPSRGLRIGLTSAIVAAYSFAAAFEHRRGRGGREARRNASSLFAAHGGFFALRAVLGPAFGFAASAPDGAPGWGALLGVEAVAFAALVAVVSARLSLAVVPAEQRRPPPEGAREDALDDRLTGVANRRALHGSGVALLEGCRAAGRPACLLLMDLDGFALVNDRHGPAAGDRLLTAFARLAHDYLPPTGLVCRSGGGEFAALLPGADLGRALAVADELRALFAHLVLDGPAGPLRATVSIGVAEDPGGQEPATQRDLLDLIDRAELCLDAAKAGGRDRVCSDGEADAAGRRTAA
jgi:diguanylate cyclase (GGDEF)-like protein